MHNTTQRNPFEISCRTAQLEYTATLWPSFLEVPLAVAAAVAVAGEASVAEVIAAAATAAAVGEE